MLKSLIKSLALLLSLTLIGTASAADNPRVKIETSAGDITLELYPEKAPKTVANFLQYVDNGFYNGTIFHRVIDSFMIQGGGFDQDYTKKKTSDPIENEADNGLLNERGTVAMARTPDPHSATAQFFINSVNNRFLNHTQKSMRGWGYCVFGKVVDGIKVVDQISGMETGPGGPFPKDAPNPQVVINKISRL